MNILKTLENIMLAIFLTLFCIWGVRELEYKLRPEGVKKQNRAVYTVDAIIKV